MIYFPLPPVGRRRIITSGGMKKNRRGNEIPEFLA
jgi:hypothetical protein